MTGQTYTVPETKTVRISAHGNLVADDYRGTSRPVKLVRGHVYAIGSTERGIDPLRMKMSPGVYRELTDTDVEEEE